MYAHTITFASGACVGIITALLFVPRGLPPTTVSEFSWTNSQEEGLTGNEVTPRSEPRQRNATTVPKFATKYFIAVKSTPAAHFRRNTMRQTWLSDLSKHSEFSYRYFIDDGETNIEKESLREEVTANNDVIILKSTVSKTSATRQIGDKMIAAMKWTLENVQSQFMMIADDDTYVNSAVLFEDVKTWPARKLYLGFHMTGQRVIHYETQRDPRYAEKAFPLDVFPKYASGVFFALSYDLVAAFAYPPAALRSMTNDDSQVGTVLLAYDVQYEHRSNILPWGHQKKDTRCKPTSDIYAIHATPDFCIRVVLSGGKPPEKLNAT